MSEAPTYSLRLEDRGKYLFAHVQAERIDLQIARGYLREVAEACRALEHTRALVIREIPEVFGDAGQFAISHEAMEMFAGIKICWVNPFLGNKASLDFATTVATNRGGRFGMFSNEIEAEEWLLG